LHAADEPVELITSHKVRVKAVSAVGGVFQVLEKVVVIRKNALVGDVGAEISDDLRVRVDCGAEEFCNY